MKRQSKINNNSVYNTYSTTTDFDLQSLIDEYTDAYTKSQVDALTTASAASSSTNCKITIGDSNWRNSIKRGY